MHCPLNAPPARAADDGDDEDGLEVEIIQPAREPKGSYSKKRIFGPKSENLGQKKLTS